MTADIHQFTGDTCLDISADKVLEGAMGKLERVMVCVFSEDGQFYTASSTSDIAQCLFMLAMANKVIIDLV